MTPAPHSDLANPVQPDIEPRVDPALYLRHPLGLPRGSVRAVLALMVFGMIWVLLLLPEYRWAPIPLYLYYLLFLILGHYFAARSHTPVLEGKGQRHPLYLPRGSLRFLMVLGFVAVLGWGYYRDPGFLQRFRPALALEQPYLPIIILGAFFLGLAVSRLCYHLLAGPQDVPSWLQDVQAWIALLAVLGLAAEVIVRLVINPTLDPQRQLSLPAWEGALSGIVAFYFGARS